MKHPVLTLATRALPLMSKADKAEARQIIESLTRSANAGEDFLADFTQRAAAAFEKDMNPVCNAIVGALKANDVAALRGLRALLPHLLEQVNRDPSLADLLAHQLGKAVMDGIQSEKEGDKP